MPSGGTSRRNKRRSRLNRYLRKFLVFCFSHVGLATISVAYMLMGAVVFMYIEAPHELDIRLGMFDARSIVTDRIWVTLRDNNTAVDHDSIFETVLDHTRRHKSTTIAFIRRGFDGRQHLVNVQWTLSGAFFYSLTTISTVGYGNIACRTAVGRAVTILYAIFGIPLMLLFLAVTGDTFSITCKFVYREYVRQRIRFIKWRHERRHYPRVNSALSRLIREQLYHTAAMYGIIPPARVNEALLEEGRQEVKEVTVPIFVLTVIMVAYLVAGATMFSFWESWSFEDGFYFCFVSLALIGFGDLFPGKAVIDSSEARDRIIICAFYLLFGMALIAMCFNLAQEDVIKMFHKCAERLKARNSTAGGSGRLTRRGSQSVDPDDVIIEGGPIGGPSETPPLTVRDFHAALAAAGMLIQSRNRRRHRSEYQPSKSDTACGTPQSTSSAPATTEGTRLLMPNGNPSQIQPSWGTPIRREHESSLYSSRPYQITESCRRMVNDYQFI